MEEKKDWKKDFYREFDNGLVEMSLMYGRDMHNRPPLYDLDLRKVREIKEWCASFIEELLTQELDRAREEGYQKGWEDGSKGKVFEKIEVETEVTFKDLRDVIEGKEDAGEFLSKLKTK
jgi:hypothetical protein